MGALVAFLYPTSDWQEVRKTLIPSYALVLTQLARVKSTELSTEMVSSGLYARRNGYSWAKAPPQATGNSCNLELF